MKSSIMRHILLIALIIVLLSGCSIYTSKVENAPGRATIYSPPDTVGEVAGIGIESQDIITMCDRMMRDMMANPVLANGSPPPRVIIDSTYFRNESLDRINLNMITDRLRVGLNRAANGRMIFVGRHYADMVERERKLKQKGIVDSGSTTRSDRPFGADYRLGGRITSHDSIDQKSGLRSRWSQIVFEMVDLETGVIAWSGEYSFKKVAADSVVYR